MLVYLYCFELSTERNLTTKMEHVFVIESDPGWYCYTTQHLRQAETYSLLLGNTVAPDAHPGTSFHMGKGAE